MLRIYGGSEMGDEVVVVVCFVAQIVLILC